MFFSTTTGCLSPSHQTKSVTMSLVATSILFVCHVMTRTAESVSSSTAACPRTCFCNALSKIVYCSRRGLAAIPDGISPETLQLNLNGNAFSAPAIVRANFSRFGELEHLYMSECGVESLEVDTFLDLPNLKWLDLSNNRIKVILASTFRGLVLEHLFLNGNRNIQLVDGSFDGLIAAGLYLHDCAIKSIRPEVIMPLNQTLKNLWLNGNELERLDRTLRTVFASLQHLRLGSNPLHCGCEAIWIKEFYDNNVEAFKGASYPSCVAPPRLKGKSFEELLSTDFRCQPPVFNNIDIMFSDVQGKLKCSASGDPVPTLFWIQPSGKTTKYSPQPITEDAFTSSSSGTSMRRNHAVLGLNTGRQSAADQVAMMGMYICVANNEAGNVTLAVNVSWPLHRDGHHTAVHGASVHPSRSSQQSVSTLLDLFPSSILVADPPPDDVVEQILNSPSAAGERLVVNVTRQAASPTGGSAGVGGGLAMDGGRSSEDDVQGTERLFSVTELVGAVVATHVFTLLLSLLLIGIYYRRRTKTSQQLLQRQQADLLGSSDAAFNGYPSASSYAAAAAAAAATAAHKQNSILASDIIYHNTTNRSYLYPKGTSIVPPPHGQYT